MNRDMDRIREILIAIADENFAAVDVRDADSAYQIHLIVQRNLVDGIAVHRLIGGGITCDFISPMLTWDGNEFLETIRPLSMWGKIKKTLHDKGIGLTFEAIKLAAPVLINAAVHSS